MKGIKRLAIACHPKDEQLLKRLKVHLNDLVRSQGVELWDSQNMEAGTDRSIEVNSNFQEADLIVLMISADFFADDYCYDVIINEALNQGKKNKNKLVILNSRSCFWKNSPLGKFTVIPSKDIPIESSKWRDQDEAFTYVAKALAAKIRDNEVPIINFENNTKLPDINTDDTQEELFQTKGMSLYHQKRYQEAINAFNQVIAINPRNTFVYHNRGVSYKKLGEEDKALSDFEMSILIYPRWDKTFGSKAEILENRGQLNDALECYKKAISFAPKKAYLYAYTARVYYKMKLTEEATSYCQKALDLSPDHAFSNRMMGAVLKMLGKHKEALLYNIHVVKVEPQFISNHLKLGEAYLRVGDKRKARECYKNALTIYPENAELLSRLKKMR